MPLGDHVEGEALAPFGIDGVTVDIAGSVHAAADPGGHSHELGLRRCVIVAGGLTHIGQSADDEQVRVQKYPDSGAALKWPQRPERQPR